MKHFADGIALAKEFGISPEALAKSFKEYNEIADSVKKGKFIDPWGKKYFDAVPYDLNDSFYVAIITPVLHYTMGGIKIDTDACCLKEDGSVIPGVFGAGEVNGGIHGLNRLGGSSLLDCVVFGRVAGATAAKYLLQENLKSQVQGGGGRQLLYNRMYDLILKLKKYPLISYGKRMKKHLFHLLLNPVLILQLPHKHLKQLVLQHKNLHLIDLKSGLYRTLLNTTNQMIVGLLLMERF